MTPKNAEDIAIAALQYIAGDETVLSQFLSLTGIPANQLRKMVQDEGFYTAILDFFLSHEPTLLAFAAHAQINPADVQKARIALNPNEHMEF